MDDDRIKKRRSQDKEKEVNHKKPKVTELERNKGNFFPAGAILLCWGRWWFGLAVVICLAGRERQKEILM